MREIASETEMIALGVEIASDLEARDVLGLCGQLGAGKTHFVKGVIQGLGGDPVSVTSPTFTLVHEYTSSRLPVFHFDFYRMENPEEVLRIGWDEYAEGGDGIVLAEWADKFPEIMPEETQWWHFEIGGKGRLVKQLPGSPQTSS